jgi:diguanylate cyclase (GGDEF)-like protein/PAS domain S-box-containing protein
MNIAARARPDSDGGRGRPGLGQGAAFAWTLASAAPALAAAPAGGTSQIIWLAALIAILAAALALALAHRSRQLGATRKALDTALAARNPVLANLPDAVWLKDPNGVYLACNPALVRLFGTDEQALVGRTDFDYLDTAEAREWRRHDKAAIEAGRALEHEDWLTSRGDGHSVRLRINRTPLYGDDGRLVGVLGVGRDVTDAYKAREELHLRESYQRALLDNFPFAVWLRDTKGNCLAANQRLAELAGVDDPAELVGRPLQDSLPEDWCRLSADEERSVLATRRRRELEFEIDLGGEVRQWFEVFLGPVQEDGGRLLGSVGFAREVTERHRMDQALRDSEARLRSVFDNSASVMLIIDPGSGRIVEANPAAARFYGYPVSKLRTLDMAQLAAAADTSAFDPELQEQNAFQRLASGELREVDIHATPIESGGSRLLFAIVRDLTERRRAEQALATERELFSAGPVAVFTWLPQPGWPVEHVSSNISSVLGYSPDECMAADFRFADLIHPDDLPGIGREVENNLANRIDEFEQSYRLHHNQDGYTWFQDFTRVERDAAGEVVRIHGYLFDLSQRKQLEMALADERNRLQATIEGTRTATWEWNVQTGETRFNERWAEIIGYRLEELAPVSIETWAHFAHPDDLERSNEVLQRHFAGESDYYECEARMRHRDGHWVWVLDRGRVFERDQEGRPLWMAGTHQDISAQKEAEESHRLAAAVFGHALEAIMITDGERRVLDVNAAFTRITGYARDEVVGREAGVLECAGDDRELYSRIWSEATERGRWTGELWSRRRSGEPFAKRLALSRVGGEGQITHFVALFSDVTAQKEHEYQLERIAYYDPLTDLPNRVLLQDRLRHAIAHAERRNRRLAVVYIDLDGFKQVNDAAGHAAGDRLLAEIAMRLRGAVREEDTVARIGGDEFVAVLVDLPQRDAWEEPLQRLLEASSGGRQGGRVTASLGVALYPQGEPVDADVLLRQADRAMYAAKQAGKNCFRVFEPGMPEIPVSDSLS